MPSCLKIRSVLDPGRPRSDLRASGLILLMLVLGVSIACGRQEPADTAPTSDGVQIEETGTPEGTPYEATPPAEAPYEATPPAVKTPDPAPRERPRRIPDSQVAKPAPVPAPAPAPPAPKPVREPAPEPRTVTLTVPEGTEMRITMLDSLDSGTSQPGDQFQATLLSPILAGDRVVLPEGSTVDGTITQVIPASKGIKESGGSLTLSFDQVTTPQGSTFPLEAGISQMAKSVKKKSGAIAGGAVGGAILGKVLGGKTKDAAIGAVIGGAIGTGVAAGTKGTEMKIEAGSEMTIALSRALAVNVDR